MHRSNRLTAPLVLAVLGAAPIASYAASDDNPTGPYVGAGWGRFNLNIRDLNDAGTAVGDIVHSDDNAWKIFVGYRFMPYLAVEGAYVDLGRPSDRFSSSGSNGNYRVNISGFSPAVIGTLPLGPVEVFGKLGWYYYNTKLDVNFDNPGPSVHSSHTRNDLLYGGGVGITAWQRLHIRAEYETIEIENAKHSDAFWLSGAWRF